MTLHLPRTRENLEGCGHIFDELTKCSDCGKEVQRWLFKQFRRVKRREVFLQDGERELEYHECKQSVKLGDNRTD